MSELILYCLSQSICFCNNVTVYSTVSQVQITELLVAILGKDEGDKVSDCEAYTLRAHDLDIPLLRIKIERPLRRLLAAPLLCHTGHGPVHRAVGLAQNLEEQIVSVHWIIENHTLFV